MTIDRAMGLLRDHDRDKLRTLPGNSTGWIMRRLWLLRARGRCRSPLGVSS